MSCPKTPHLLKEYFSDNLSVIAREEIEAHVASCDDCRGISRSASHERCSERLARRKSSSLG